LASDAETSYQELSASKRRRLAWASLVRSMLVSLVIVVGYFVLPLRRLDGSTAVYLGAGLVLVALVLAWQVREITRSPYPRIRAIGSLATSVPLFIVVFSATYYLMEQAKAGSYSEPMTRLDAVYFTVTIFATVGFGDITPVSAAARVVATVQMLGDLVIVGLGVKVLFTAVQTGLSRRNR
jgi:voltage-gated potassium channel